MMPHGCANRSLYLLKGDTADRDAWQRFVAACHAEGHTVKWVLMRMIRAYAGATVGPDVDQGDRGPRGVA